MNYYILLFVVIVFLYVFCYTNLFPWLYIPPVLFNIPCALFLTFNSSSVYTAGVEPAKLTQWILNPPLLRLGTCIVIYSNYYIQQVHAAGIEPFYL